MPTLTGITNPATDQLLNAYLGSSGSTSQSGNGAARGVRPTSGTYAGLSAEDIIKRMANDGFTQEGVNTVYLMRGLGTPPTVPAELAGRGYVPTRGGRRWSDGSSVTGAANSFLNEFNSTAADPFRSYDLGNWLGVAGMVVGAAGAAGAFNPATAGTTGASTAGTTAGAGTTGGSSGLGAFAPGSSVGSMATSNAGLLAQSGAITGGAGIGGTAAGALGPLSGAANTISGVGRTMGWQDWIPSLVTAGASLIGGDRAGDAVQAGSREAIDESRRQFDLVRGDTAPLRALGTASIGTLADMSGYNASGRPNMEAFYTSPEYSFNLSEGQKAIDRSAAARGGLLSGAAVKEGQRYASGLASRESSAYFDRLLQQAGLGNTGIGASAAAGANTASNVGNAAINSGNARASIYGDTAANLNNAFQSGYSNMMLRRYLGG